jgi:hypothetical protein
MAFMVQLLPPSERAMSQEAPDGRGGGRAMPDETLEFCRVCGSTVARSAPLCPTCGRLRRRPLVSVLILVIAPVITAVVVPAALLLMSSHWTSKISTQQRLQILTEETRSKVIPLILDFDRVARALEEPCAPSSEAGSQSSLAPECVKFYEERLRDLDSQIVRLSWSLDSLPIEQHTYNGMKDLKKAFWERCDDGAPDTHCDYRQQLKRIIGLDGAQPRALITCTSSLMYSQSDAADAEKCRQSRKHLSKVIQDLVNQANIVFCAVALDMNRSYAVVLQQQDEKEFGYRLEYNTNHSDCQSIVKQRR